MDHEPPHERLRVLEPLLGDWTVEAVFPQGVFPEGADLRGSTSFTWTLDGAFLLQQAEVDHPAAPNVHALIGVAPAGTGFLQHYFDSRGVVRLYEMTFDGRLWRLERYPPAPDFAQRFRAELSADGSTITGAWEAHRDDAFVHDFALTYRRVAA
ncbi:MAG TPA: hypothetical protein VNT03_20835 [Baekduia sp.]|nr:hypothetical protein [Baekduia sp.]